MHLLHGAVYVHHHNIAAHFVSILPCTIHHFSPHTQAKKYLPSFFCGDADNPETRTDAGEQGERGEGSSELGIAVFAVGEPAN